MPTITIDLTDQDIESVRELLCHDKESVPEAIKRIIISEIKNRKLQTLLRN